jgi:uncharacterized protein YndB with AHSA1/START domain
VTTCIFGLARGGKRGCPQPLWTSKDFDTARSLLSPTLAVEVPINYYPTPASFLEALARFANQVTSVDVLSRLGGTDEAMLLYDLEVNGLGALRVAEHFAIRDGLIVTLRQVHDTVAVRAAGIAAARPSTGTSDDDYTCTVAIKSPPERVHSALTTLEGIAGWWTALVEGSAQPAGTIELRFDGLDERITMHVDSAAAPTGVIWTCTTNTGHPEWAGTTVMFGLTPTSAGTVLAVRHVGLTNSLVCYEQCSTGWARFLASLKAYVERGAGSPYGSRT